MNQRRRKSTLTTAFLAASLIIPFFGFAQRILTGADQMEKYLPLLKGQNIAVFANQTSVIGQTHLVDTLIRSGVHVSKIFSPEHGFRGKEPDGAHINNSVDSATGVPIVSLYGDKSKPTAADLAGIDILVFDIQDVGARFYTYITSLQKYIEAAIQNDRPIIVLDRPNPNSFYVDGPVLDLVFRSSVGMQPIPVVYGMTIGEYARMLIGQHWLDTAIKDYRTPNKNPRGYKLTVIPCRNYTHASRYQLPVAPSPNLPNMQSVYLYPSICFFEGTDVSLGRGTSKPFQQFGCPYFPHEGYHFTPESMPSSRKPPLQGQTCYGYDLSGIDVAAETHNGFTLKWILQAWQLTSQKDSFFLPTKYINKLAGTDILARQIRQGLSEKEIRQSWQPALDNFKKIRKKYLIYAD